MTLDPVELTKLALERSRATALEQEAMRQRRQARKPQQFTWLGYDGATGKGIVRGPDGSILNNQDVITSGSIPVGTAINMKSQFVDWIPAQIEETPPVTPVEEKPDITLYFNADGDLGEYLLKGEVYTRSRRIVLSTAFVMDSSSTTDPLVLNHGGILGGMFEPGFTVADKDTLFLYYLAPGSRFKLYTLNLSSRALIETPLSIAESAISPAFEDAPYSMCRSLDGTIFVMMDSDLISSVTGERTQYLYRRKPDGTEEIKSFAVFSAEFWSIASTDGNKVWAIEDYFGLVIFDFDAGTVTYPPNISFPDIQTTYPDITETTYLTLDRETGDIYVIALENYTPTGFPSVTASKTFTVTGNPAPGQYTATVDTTADLVPGSRSSTGTGWTIRQITSPTTVVAYSVSGLSLTTTMNNRRPRTAIYKINQATNTLTNTFDYPESFQFSELYNLPSRGGVAKRGNLYQLGFIGNYTSPEGIFFGGILSDFVDAERAGLTDPPFFMAVRNNSLIPLKIRFDKKVPSNLVDDIRNGWFYFRFLEVAE